jgi:osomolarity two-component system response regulator SSK1
MQALIDFDGWRKWKDFATDSDNTKNTSKLSTSMASIAPSAKKDDDKKAKRKSIGVLPPPLLQEDESEAPTPEEGSA